MKNFEHECNGKVEDFNLETEAKCDKCNCENEDITDTPCNCSCHND